MSALAARNAPGPHAELVRALAAWFRDHRRPLPWREPGFPAWGVLVSEIMLQQTPVARVVPRLAAWLERWPTPADLAAVPPGEAVRAWDRLGYPRRALRLHEAAVVIAERHANVVPAELDDLLALPGVGEYTARAVAVFAYGRRHPVVDVNVRRVLARAVEGRAQPAAASTRRDLELLESLLPHDPAEAAIVDAAAMELGALVCVARRPRCAECPIATECAWRRAGCPAHDGPPPRTQRPYAGSDREVRGRLLALVRSSEVPVAAADLEHAWPDAVQRERALAGLVADGLVVAEDDAYALP